MTGRPGDETTLDAAQREVRLLRRLLEGSSDIVNVLDRDGSLMHEFQSRGHVLGYDPGELVGRTVFGYVHPDDVTETLEAFRRLRREPGREEHLVLRYRHKRGHWVTLEVMARNALEDPEIQGLVVYSRDVTDREALENKLRVAQRMESVGRLASGIAHDFNNLLAVITMAVAAGQRGPGEARDALQDIAQVADRGSGLVKRLMAFVRDRPARPRRFELVSRVDTLASILRALLPESIQLVIDVPEPPCHVVADPVQLEQVLINLVLNARDAMPRGGTVHLRVREASARDTIELEVEDTGIGMDESTRARAFEPFFTTKGDQRGTGLGLSTVRDAVEACAGRIEISSAPERGTRVRIELPVRAPH